MKSTFGLGFLPYIKLAASVMNIYKPCPIFGRQLCELKNKEVGQGLGNLASIRQQHPLIHHPNPLIL